MKFNIKKFNKGRDYNYEEYYKITYHNLDGIELDHREIFEQDGRSRKRDYSTTVLEEAQVRLKMLVDGEIDADGNEIGGE